MDVINLISKAPGLPDAPITEPTEKYQPAFMHFANGPRVHEYLKEMNKAVLSKHDLMTVGETPFTHSPDQLAPYVLPTSKEQNMVFQFQLMYIDVPHSGGSEPFKHNSLVWTKWR
jgi:alpha-glucosidase